MSVWGQVWWESWLSAAIIGFSGLVISIVIICLLAEMNYRKKKPLAGKHKGQRKI